MANVETTSSLNGISGTIDKFTYRRRGKKVFVGAKQGKRSTPLSPAQEAHKLEFLDARDYATVSLTHPERGVIYREVAKSRGSTALGVAIGDWFKAPKIEQLKLDAYQGVAGELISVRAVDDVEVVAVRVTIRETSNGSVLEEGPAVKIGTRWVYTAISTLPQGTPVEIEARATDHPGNEGTLAAPFVRE